MLIVPAEEEQGESGYYGSVGDDRLISLQCSGQFPCRKCVDLKVECIFAPPDTDRRSRSFLRSMQVDHENERRLLKEAVQELSRTLQELALEPPMNPERRSEVDEILAKVRISLHLDRSAGR